MIQKQVSRLSEILSRQKDSMVEEWLQQQLSDSSLARNLQDEKETRTESEKFLGLFLHALENLDGADPTDIDAPRWSEVRLLLENLSRNRAIRGYTPTETATFVSP